MFSNAFTRMQWTACFLVKIRWFKTTYVNIQRRIQNPESKMELFAKIVYSLQPLTVFYKNLHIRCLTGFQAHIIAQI